MRNALLFVTILSSICVSESFAQTEMTYSDIVARLYDLKTLADPPLPGERAGNASSFNRTSRYNSETDEYEEWQFNWDGGGAVRREGDSMVAAEIDGPGVLWRFWSASAGKGHIKIFIDGKEQPALDIPYQDFMNGEEGAFAYPELVLTMSRGKNSFIPIPFQKSCKVVLEKGWGMYYQITYSQFPKETIIPSFRGEFNEEERAALQKANDVFARRGADPKQAGPDRHTVNETVTIKPGESVDVCNLTGRRAITQIHVRPYPDENSIRTLRELTLSITWDDEKEPAVWTPLGDFFGTAPGINPFKSIPTGMSDKGFYAYWYMPFARSARMTITNEGTKTRKLSFDVQHEQVESDGPLLRFHAKWHRDDYAGLDKKRFTHGDRWPDWPLLVTENCGRFVGVNMHIWNPNPFGKIVRVLDVDVDEYSARIYDTMLAASGGWWWGEGDEKFFVDGEKMPSTYGTGSEDYFGYAWAAHNPVEYESALANQPLNKNSSLGHVSNNRFQIADSVPFQKRFEAVMEKYHPNNWPLQYACTAYWYQTAGEKNLYRSVPVEQRVDYYKQPDPSLLTPASGVYEAELHLSYNQRAAKRRQRMTSEDGKWSNEYHLPWKGPINGEFTVSFEVAENYEGPITAGLTMGPNYGVFDVLLDGKPLKEGIDLYGPKVAPSPRLNLGMVKLSKGTHQLKFRLTGHNELAKNIQDKLLMLGIDYIALVPAE